MSDEVIIPVTMVETIPEPPAPDPEPEPEPEPAAIAEPEPAPIKTQKSPVRDASSVRSPIMAAPGETADGAVAAGEPVEDSDPPLPSISAAEEKAVNALKAFRCNRLGVERPADCDDAARASFAAIAEEAGMKPQRWTDFELPAIDPEIQRIWAEDCPPDNGVINDVFTQETTYYRQGAHAGAGSLSKNSINERCP